ncbi:MAG: hypothetical protein ACTXOO_00570 [Sodalis sp. (in: enterobacteria)]
MRQVPGVRVSDTVQIVRNPWRDSEAQVVMMNETDKKSSAGCRKWRKTTTVLPSMARH